jgi:hypothetical protein
MTSSGCSITRRRLNLSHVVWMQHYPANNYTIVRILENKPITVRETPEELLGRRADATTRMERGLIARLPSRHGQTAIAFPSLRIGTGRTDAAHHAPDRRPLPGLCRPAGLDRPRRRQAGWPHSRLAALPVPPATPPKRSRGGSGYARVGEKAERCRTWSRRGNTSPAASHHPARTMATRHSARARPAL